ncbi:FtsW/RodA/SpoVE family cell cycle protein [Secundilactobacillus kimchicus]
MMWLASGIPWRRSFRILVVTVAFIVCILFPIAVKLSESGAIKSYKLARVLAFVDPFGHASSAGAQLVNSYYALSNGGLFGVGLGNSIQKRGYLPEPNTDFIMAIVGEELGLVGIVVILILLAIIIGRAVQLGIRSTNGYYALLCYGIATYFTVQAVINVGGVAGVLPITGVTFPFISYGGSSMFSLTLALGTLLNISTRERKERNHDV